MSTYKKLLSSDVVVTPFEVNKHFYFEGETILTGSNVGIQRFLGENTSSLFSLNDPKTGTNEEQYKRLVYNSIRGLYYSNYLSNIEGTSFVGDSYQASGSFYNYPQSDLYYRKYFPTSSEIGVISIPSKLYGEKIQPTTFFLNAESGSITDDGEGNLIYNSRICGNIIYNQGIAIITSDGSPDNEGQEGAVYGDAVYGDNNYGYNLEGFIESFITSSNITCSFSSSFHIYETQFKCTITEDEFNLSMNPSLLNSSVRGNNEILTSGSATYSNYVTSSFFSPYVTTIGLYNEHQELMAVAKLAQPLPTSQTTDTTIFINIDK